MFALTDSEISARCPQVFQTDHVRSGRYGQYTTYNVIDALRTEGFEVTNAFAQGSRKQQNNPFGRHCVRLTHHDFLDTLKPEDERPEIVVINSNDGTSSFRVIAGVFRLVCSNGLVVSTEEFGNARIRHFRNNDFNAVIDASLQVAEQAKEAFDTIEKMKSINLSESQQKEFAEFAAKIRFKYNKNAKINNAYNLLIPRRVEDTLKPTVWNTYNVLQENCIKGGQIIGTRPLRPLNNISHNVEVNEGLWKRATELAS